MTQRHPRPNKTIEADDARKTINFMLSPLLAERLDGVLDSYDFKKNEFISKALEALLELRDAAPEVDLASELDPAVLAIIEQVDPAKAERIRAQVMALQKQAPESSAGTFRYVARPLIETERVISYISQDLKTRIDELANRDGVTLRTLFRTAITLSLEEYPEKDYSRLRHPLNLSLVLEESLLEQIEARASELDKAPDQVAIKAITTWLDEHVPATNAPSVEGEKAASVAPIRYLDPPTETSGAVHTMLELELEAELYHRLQRRVGFDMIEPGVFCYPALVETFEPV